jgi:hypothetical protein
MWGSDTLLPVTIVYGGRPCERCVVKRIIIKAWGMKSLQYALGYSLMYLRVTSLNTLIVTSTNPFALLFPTVMHTLGTPIYSKACLNSASHSVPLSERTKVGLPQRAITSL